MSLWLRQSTAATVEFGPFLLNSDGVTLVTNLVGTGSNQTENTSTGIRISKNGGTLAARHATAGVSTYDAFGVYQVQVDTTDTNTLGMLRLIFANGAAFCPVWVDYMVVPANVWDSMFGATYLKVDLTQILTTAVSTPATAGILDVNTKNMNNVAATAITTIKAVQGLTTADTIATYTGNTKQTGDVFAALPANFSAFVIDASGRVNAFLVGILTSVFTEGATGRIAAAFKQFFNIASPTSTMNEITLVDTMTTYTGNTLQTADVAARTPAALTANGNMKSSLVEILTTALTETAGQLAGGFKKFFNIAAPASTMDHLTLIDTATTATTATNLTNAPTAGDFTATMKTSLSNATPSVTVSDKTGFSLSAAGIQAIWDALTSALSTVNSIGKLLVTNIDALISSRTKPADTQARVTLVDTLTTYTSNTPQTGDNFARIGATGSGLTSLAQSSTALSTVQWTNARAALLDALSTGVPLTVAERNAVADAIFARTLGSESYAALHAVPTFAQMQFMLLSLLDEFAITGTTITNKKIDGSTTAMTSTLDSSTAPTSRTRAT